MADPETGMSEEDRMAAEWAAALNESKPEGEGGGEVATEAGSSRAGAEVAHEVRPAAESVAPAQFPSLRPDTRPGAAAAPHDLNMILDIPVQLTVELGRTRIPIKHILQLAQGSVVELETLAGEPMDVLVNGYLIAQGEVVVVNDKFGIRLTDIVTPSERIRRLSRL
jgi:flagellar motor switch protein FliN